MFIDRNKKNPPVIDTGPRGGHFQLPVVGRLDLRVSDQVGAGEVSRELEDEFRPTGDVGDELALLPPERFHDGGCRPVVPTAVPLVVLFDAVKLRLQLLADGELRGPGEDKVQGLSGVVGELPEDNASFAENETAHQEIDGTADSDEHDQVENAEDEKENGPLPCCDILSDEEVKREQEKGDAAYGEGIFQDPCETIVGASVRFPAIVKAPRLPPAFFPNPAPENDSFHRITGQKRSKEHEADTEEV